MRKKIKSEDVIDAYLSQLLERAGYCEPNGIGETPEQKVAVA